jgi:hypothetical protein
MFHINKPFKNSFNNIFKNVDAGLGSRRSQLISEACRVRAARESGDRCAQEADSSSSQPQSLRRKSLDDSTENSSVDPIPYGRRNSAPGVTVTRKSRSFRGSNKVLLRQPLANSILTTSDSAERMELDGFDESYPQCLRRTSIESKRSSMDRNEHRRSSMPMSSTQATQGSLLYRGSAPHTTAPPRRQRTVDFSARYTRRAYV